MAEQQQNGEDGGWLSGAWSLGQSIYNAAANTVNRWAALLHGSQNLIGWLQLNLCRERQVGSAIPTARVHRFTPRQQRPCAPACQLGEPACPPPCLPAPAAA